MAKPRAFIRVDTFHVDEPDDITATRTIDHNDPDDYSWLAKHLYWALRNKHGVECSPISGE